MLCNKKSYVGKKIPLQTFVTTQRQPFEDLSRTENRHK